MNLVTIDLDDVDVGMSMYYSQNPTEDKSFFSLQEHLKHLARLHEERTASD